MDLILHNGKLTTLDRGNPEAPAIAIKDGLIDMAAYDNGFFAGFVASDESSNDVAPFFFFGLELDFC